MKVEIGDTDTNLLLVTDFRGILSVASSRMKQRLTCAETSVTSYQWTLCNITEERRSREYGGGSMKLRTALLLLTSYFMLADKF